MTGITLETGTSADRDDVAGFIGQLYDANDYSLPWEALQDRADDMLAAGPVYFLCRDGRRIGYSALKDMGDHMFIRHFVIDKSLRGAGVGTEAFNALRQACFPDRQIRLDASLTVPAPRAFWESQGFKVMGYTMRRDAEATV